MLLPSLVNNSTNFRIKSSSAISSIDMYALPLNSAAFSSASTYEVYKKSKNVPSIRNYNKKKKFIKNIILHSNLL